MVSQLSSNSRAEYDLTESQVEETDSVLNQKSHPQTIFIPACTKQSNYSHKEMVHPLFLQSSLVP